MPNKKSRIRKTTSRERIEAGPKEIDKVLNRRIVLEQNDPEGITPLEVILQVMRRAHDEADKATALAAARLAAPYIHPRLQAIEHKGSKDPVQLVIRWLEDHGDKGK